jgi:hypothetical protein
MEFTLNEGFLSYPTNKVIAILRTPEELKGAITELNNTGFKKDRVQVACGEKAAERLDVDGEHHGFLSKAYRAAELNDLKEYESELLAGHFLVAVDAPDETERTRVSNILEAHGGERVTFYGRWTIERPPS